MLSVYTARLEDLDASFANPYNQARIWRWGRKRQMLLLVQAAINTGKDQKGLLRQMVLSDRILQLDATIPLNVLS